MKLIEAFVDKLKKINRYDNALIVIHGDHGSHFAGQLLDIEGSSFATNMDSAEQAPYDNSLRNWSLSKIATHARALLMIKPLSTTGKMQISDVPTQLLDVYPTIMGQLGIDNLKNIAGADILNNRDLYHRQRYFYYMGGSAHETQITNYHTMVPQYDKKSGILSLTLKSKGKTTAHSFFKHAEGAKKYKDIEFYYTSVDGKIITDVAWVFFDGMDILNHWGAWTNSDKVTLAFIPEDTGAGEYKKLTLKIADAFINDKNTQLNAKFYLNNTHIGVLEYNMPKGQYSFPHTVDFVLAKDVIIKGKPNIIEIEIDGANSEKNLGIGKDTRKLGLAFVKLSLVNDADLPRYQSIRLTKPADSQGITINGAANAESWGTSTMAEQADVSFLVQPGNFNVVKIKAKGFLTADYPKTAVQVSLNGTPLGKMSFDIADNTATEFTFKLAKNLLIADDFNVFSFYIEDYHKNTTGDKRILGINLMQVLLE